MPITKPTPKVRKPLGVFTNKPRLMANIAYVCTGLAIVLFAAQIWLYGMRYQSLFSDTGYSAVTLTNGQTYFGHLKKYGLSTFVLSDVYYLQQKTESDDTTGDDTTAADTTTTDETDTGLQLVKLSNDLHQPENFLAINRDNVEFWQTLQSDSPIIDTINKDKAQQ